MSTQNTFEEVRKRHQAQLKQLKRRIAWLAVARLFLFLAAAAGVYFTFGLSWWPAIIAVVGLAAFLFAVRMHTDLKEQRDQTKNAIEVCDEELARGRGEWRSMAGGEAHIDHDHPYTSDLGVFGKHSLYQYVNRTQSQVAAFELSAMLGENLTDPAVITEERKYIDALAGDMDFAVSYLARSKRLRAEDQNFDAVRKWVEGGEGKSGFYDLWSTRLLPLYAIAATLAYGFGVFSGSGYLLLMLVPGLAIFFHLNRHQKKFAEFDTIFGRLPAYEVMLAMLRTRANQNETIAERWSTFELDKSDYALKKLRAIAGAIDARNNIFVSIVLNLLLLWDFQVDRRLRKWRSEYAEELSEWLELTASVEAYLSPAIFVHNHPDFVYPRFSEDFEFRIEDARHVLLGNEAIPNDLDLSGETKFSIITGANMAGKSTYLRTVGTCLILAMRGLPVPAKFMRFKPTELYTSMLTADSLGEGESYFFSELKRLKQLTEVLETGRPLFIILDEILKGTNSKDKAVGSKKFLAKLLSLPAKGLIATHDLSLCDIADVYPGQVVNRSFEVEFRGEDLHFDYKLREGVCENMNAAFLLRKMGLTMDE